MLFILHMNSGRFDKQMANNIGSNVDNFLTRWGWLSSLKKAQYWREPLSCWVQSLDNLMYWKYINLLTFFVVFLLVFSCCLVSSFT